MDKPLFTVYLKNGADGFIIAECLEIPGCMSQGRTIQEARENIKDAINSCLSVILEDHLKEKRKGGRYPDDIIEKDRFQVNSFEVVAV